MQRDKRKVESALQAKGFQRDERHHHYFLYRTQQGLLTDIRTRTSHSGKDIDRQLLAEQNGRTMPPWTRGFSRVG